MTKVKDTNPMDKLLAVLADMNDKLDSLSARVETVESIGTTARRSTKKTSAKTDKSKAEREARYAAIDANRALWVEKYDLKKAVSLAKAEAAKNEAAGFVNENIAKCSPNSRRRFLTSATNQSLRAVREKHEVKASVVESMLNAQYVLILDSDIPSLSRINLQAVTQQGNETMTYYDDQPVTYGLFGCKLFAAMHDLPELETDKQETYTYLLDWYSLNELEPYGYVLDKTGNLIFLG